MTEAGWTPRAPSMRRSPALTPFNEYFTKLLTQVSSGTAPDVGWHHSSQIQLHIVRGVVQPLDAFMRRAPVPDDFYSLAHYQRGGKTSYFKETFIDATENAEPVPFTPSSPDIEKLMIEELEPVWLGKRAAKEAADALQPRIDDLLKAEPQ